MGEHKETAAPNTLVYIFVFFSHSVFCLLAQNTGTQMLNHSSACKTHTFRISCNMNTAILYFFLSKKKNRYSHHKHDFFKIKYNLPKSFMF